MTEEASLDNQKIHAISRTVSRMLLIAEARVCYQGSLGEFCVGKVAMGRISHRVHWHSSAYLFPPILHTHIHSSTIDVLKNIAKYT
jgi:hypothetical protein